MNTNIITGTVSGASVMGALWALTGGFVRSVGLAGASLLSQWLSSGAVVDSDPWIAYRWGILGAVTGGLVGAGVGALAGGQGGRASGVLVGAYTALAGLVTSMAVLVFATGTEFLAELFSLTALVAAAGAVTLGSSVGTLVRFALGSMREAWAANGSREA